MKLIISNLVKLFELKLAKNKLCQNFKCFSRILIILCTRITDHNFIVKSRVCRLMKKVLSLKNQENKKMKILSCCVCLLLSGVLSQENRPVVFRDVLGNEILQKKEKGISCSIDKRTSTETLKCTCDVRKNSIVSHHSNK